LAFTPKFIRAVWFKLAAESTQLGFSAPLTLISKGVVREYHLKHWLVDYSKLNFIPQPNNREWIALYFMYSNHIKDNVLLCIGN